jgi:hypothetical protein
MMDNTHRILVAFRSLIKAYDKAEDDTPGYELLLSRLPKSKSLWFHKWMLKYNPYTATPVVRHFVETHINSQLRIVYKALKRLDRESFTKNETRPFEDACRTIREYRSELPKRWVVSLAKISIPSFVTGAAVYLWHQYQQVLAVGFLKAEHMLGDQATIFLALTALSMGAVLLMQMFLAPIVHSFMRKRTIFTPIYAKENELFDEIRKLLPKVKKKKEFPLDLTMSFAGLLPLAAMLCSFVLGVWDNLRFQNEFAHLYERLPRMAKYAPPDFTPPHLVRVFDGPFWISGVLILLLLWTVIGFSLSWRARVFAKQT